MRILISKIETEQAGTTFPKKRHKKTGQPLIQEVVRLVIRKIDGFKLTLPD
jgi:hypothetical protein